MSRLPKCQRCLLVCLFQFVLHLSIHVSFKKKFKGLWIICMEGTHRKKLSLERIVWKEMMKVMVYAIKLIDKKADLL